MSTHLFLKGNTWTIPYLGPPTGPKPASRYASAPGEVQTRLKSLEKFQNDIDAQLRSMHVSLRLLAEESRRLLARSAREHELKTLASENLAKATT